MKNLLLFLLLSASALFAQNVITVTDADITGSSGTVNWTKNNIYLLDGYVYVESPTILNIEAGTVIKAKEAPTTGDVASVLVITRGAKINAVGTAQEPIIFTTEYDDTNLPDNGTDPGVDYRIDRGLWGGVVLLGKAVLNVAFEKVVEGLPATDDRAKYGGSDDADNSGVFKYVSIRYTGITVEANKELQGLTLGCVGSNTVVEYVESFNSSDDGFEFFGGTVNTKYLISAFADDDAFDYDQGFRGFHQFWFAIQGDSVGDHLGEFDSGDSGALTNEPLSKPVIYNATFIGRGANATGGDIALMYKEYGGGEIYNSIITDFDKSGVKVDSGSGLTCYNRFADGQLILQNNIWYKNSSSTVNDIAGQFFMQQFLGNPANANTLINPQLYSIARSGNNLLDARPMQSSPAFTLPRKQLPAGNNIFSSADFYGAFGAENWAVGWTNLNSIGLLTDVKNADESNIPSEYSLGQNYPNPFNPATKINFSIPEAGNVRLIVYNILGQQVAELVNGFKNIGAYEINWDASKFTSGVYLYKLETSAGSFTKKMSLTK